MASEETAKKLFVGPRIRRIRRDLGLTQTRMAEELGISPSYLNLIERNQRPVTAQLILKLAEVYDIELRNLAGAEEARAFADLNEIFSDPLFKGHDIPKHELQDLGQAAPGVVDGIQALYRAYREAKSRMTSLSEEITDRTEADRIAETRFPVDEVRDFIQAHNNYFSEIDEAAETLAEKIRAEGDTYNALRRHLREAHNVDVTIMPSDIMSETLRRFDRHRRRLMLSEILEPSSRAFQLAYQIGLFEQDDLIERLLNAESFKEDATRRLAKISLANYFAGALVMPYERFLTAADESGYDIDLLGHRFGTSFEQVCHRLTTLQRTGRRGIPFFMIRIDNAGNISKRFSAGRFHFAKYGGTCPRWNLYDTFQTPGRILTQIVQMPDETTYFTIARTVMRAGTSWQQPAQKAAVGIGCDLSYARRLVYSKGFDLDDPDITPIGATCRMCERPNCAQRAFPPLTRELVVDERNRPVSPFTFQLD